MINEPQHETYTDEKGIEYGNYGKLLKKSSIINGSLVDLVEYFIPDSVTIIKKGAFKECYNLRSITISESVTEIGDTAFAGCSSLESITIPNSVTKIGSAAFRNCSSLESITIPDSATVIGDEAFAGCMYLQSIKVSDHVNKNALQSILNDLDRDIERLHRLREQLTTART